jgi:hypothetical protein
MPAQPVLSRLLLLLAVALGACQPQGTEQVPLRYNWLPGQAWTQAIAVQMDITTELGGQSTTVHQHLAFTLQVSVDSLLPGGQRVLQARYTRLRITQYAGQDVQTIDSQDSLSWHSTPGRLYHPLLASRFRIRTDERCAEVYVTNLTPQDAQAAAAPQDAERRLGAKALQELLQLVWLGLPDSPTAESWRSQRLTEGNLPMAMTQTWTRVPGVDSLRLQGVLQLHPQRRMVQMGLASLRVHTLSGTASGAAWLPDGNLPPQVHLRQDFRAAVGLAMVGLEQAMGLVVHKQVIAAKPVAIETAE